jgi:trehalose 6-phosphate phosphatase
MTDSLAVPVGQAALFLDFDGAFAALQGAPDEVAATAERTGLLVALQARLEGRFAVLSGRTLADLDRVTDGKVEAVAALNGLQRRAPGRLLDNPEPHPCLEEVADLLTGLARTSPGVRTEPKGLSVAVHFRGAPEAADELRRILLAIGDSTGLAFHEDSMVVELATPGWDKGRAIEDLMAWPPFQGATPIFAGDAAADEPAFAAVAGLGGVGVLIGEPRETAALARVASPADLRSVLRRALDTGVFQLPCSAAAASGGHRQAARRR